jgi:hypothetical protein
MIEVKGNLWTYPADWRVITTNGTIKTNGECVMGRGCAKEAAKMYPKFPTWLGERILRHGNHVHKFTPQRLFTFPVKHHWYERANLDLIERSVGEFMAQLEQDKTYVMPRPGCGNGGRTWKEIQPFLYNLPDNVHVIDFPNDSKT